MDRLYNRNEGEDRMSQEEHRTPLAPSGISAHNHLVETIGGSLQLYWTWNNQEHLRAFTPEETLNLLNFLEQHRSEIEAGNIRWSKGDAPQAVCCQCGKQVGKDVYTRTENRIKQIYCSYCYRSQFD